MLKKVVAAAAASLLVGGASAATITSGTFSGTSFTNLVVGTISVGATSNLSGNFFAADSVTFGNVLSLTLDVVTFTSGTVETLTDSDPTAVGFNFSNVPAGSYLVKASGWLDNSGQLADFAVIGANYTVTPVPEPTAAAMLLAGFAVMGFIAMRRRRQD